MPETLRAKMPQVLPSAMKDTAVTFAGLCHCGQANQQQFDKSGQARRLWRFQKMCGFSKKQRFRVNTRPNRLNISAFSEKPIASVHATLLISI